MSAAISAPNKPSKQPPETPESVRRALRLAQTASNELIKTAKSLLNTPPPDGQKSADSSLSAIAKLAGLVHSHTIRTALVCGPTAFSPAAALGCLQDLHKPILPIVAEYQKLANEGFPEYFVRDVRMAVTKLLDTFGGFLDEIVEIACGEASVESHERLQNSGMMMESCARIEQICKAGPISVLRQKLRETEGMLDDALEDLGHVITGEETDGIDDGWGDERIEYTPEQKEFASKIKSKLQLLSFLYKAIYKRRVPTNTSYDASVRETLDTMYGCLGKLSEVVDDLVAGIASQEEPMGLELSMVQAIDEARKLATAVRPPLNGITDGRETWFDTWLEKVV